MTSVPVMDEQCQRCAWLRNSRYPYCDVFAGDRLPPDGWRRADGRCSAYLEDRERARLVASKMRAGHPIGDALAPAGVASS